MTFRNVFIPLILSALISSLSVSSARAGDEGWQSIGVRGGFSMTEKATFFHQYEAFAAYGLPLHTRGDSGWGVTTRANISAGDLHGGGKDAFVGSFGPSVVFDKNGRGFQFEIGGDFVILGRRHFGLQDFGGIGLFQGHGSISYIFRNGLGIQYRAQHTSNAGLYGTTNPGYDLHLVGVSWNF